MEVLRAYSNDFALKSTLDRLGRKRWSRPVSTLPTHLPHKVAPRLNPETIQRIITDYEAGNSTIALMRLYDISKGAVTRVLREACIQIRKQGLHAENDRAEAVKLYAAGWSAAKVGDKLGCSADTVLMLVRQAGQTVRPRVGGRQTKFTHDS